MTTLDLFQLRTRALGLCCVVLAVTGCEGTTAPSKPVESTVFRRGVTTAKGIGLQARIVSPEDQMTVYVYGTFTAAGTPLARTAFIGQPDGNDTATVTLVNSAGVPIISYSGLVSSATRLPALVQYANTSANSLRLRVYSYNWATRANSKAAEFSAQRAAGGFLLDVISTSASAAGERSNPASALRLASSQSMKSRLDLGFGAMLEGFFLPKTAFAQAGYGDPTIDFLSWVQPLGAGLLAGAVTAFVLGFSPLALTLAVAGTALFYTATAIQIAIAYGTGGGAYGAGGAIDPNGFQNPQGLLYDPDDLGLQP